MKPRTLIAVILVLGLLPWILGPGCAPMNPVLGDAPGASLTLTEQEAVDAAVDASQALAQATATGQSGPGAIDENAAQLFPNLPDNITVGTCPAATLTISSDGSAFELAIDFGEGCEPTFAEAGELCSGNASGSVDLTAKTVELTYHAITCGEESLDGRASLTYAASASLVSLEGEWSLTLTDVEDGDSLVTEGTGSCAYDKSARVASIASFNGTVTEEGVVTNLTAAGLLTSHANQGSYIPYSGTITLSGTGIRPLTIHFNQSSPSTGEVEVTIEGGLTVTVNLFDL